MSKRGLKLLYEIQTDFEELPGASNKRLLGHIVLQKHYPLKLMGSYNTVQSRANHGQEPFSLVNSMI